MSNERNVRALEKSFMDTDDWEEFNSHEIATYLASLGVLVPSALSDAECLKVHQAGDGAFTFRPAEQRAEIARIAREG